MCRVHWSIRLTSSGRDDTLSLCVPFVPAELEAVHPTFPAAADSLTSSPERPTVSAWQASTEPPPRARSDWLVCSHCVVIADERHGRDAVVERRAILNVSSRRPSIGAASTAQSMHYLSGRSRQCLPFFSPRRRKPCLFLHTHTRTPQQLPKHAVGPRACPRLTLRPHRRHRAEQWQTRRS